MYFSRYTLYHKCADDSFLLYNTLTNAILHFESIKINSTNYKSASCYSEHEIQLLSKSGFLYENEAMEHLLIRKLFNIYCSSLLKKQIAIFYIGVTFKCNLRCPYCFESNLKQADSNISIRKIDQIFCRIDSILLEKHVKGHVNIYGGEPLLENNLKQLTHIFELAGPRKLDCSLITNGVEINYFLPLITKFASIVSSVIVTIDGPKKFHDQRRIFRNGAGTFDIIITNIDLIVQHFKAIKTIIRINLDSSNIDVIDELMITISEKRWLDKNVEIHLFKIADFSNIGIENVLSDREIVQRMTILQKKFPRNFNKIKLRINSCNKLDKVFNKRALTLPFFNYCERESLYVFDSFGYEYVCPESIGDRMAAVRRYDTLGGELVPSKYWSENVLDKLHCSNCRMWPVCGGGCKYRQLKNQKTRNDYCIEITDLVNYYLTRFAQEMNVSK